MNPSKWGWTGEKALAVVAKEEERQRVERIEGRVAQRLGVPATNGHARPKLVPNSAPASEEVRQVDVLLELSVHRRLVSGTYVLDAPDQVESVWGSGHEVVWARGEPFLLCGPDGIGKTTLAQQLALAFIGIGEPELLGLPVTGDGRRVLYVAADRPEQARRSMRRMVGEDQRDLLEDRLVIWKGPLPFDLARTSDGLTALCERAECGIVVLDSLKDIAADLSKEETGNGLNAAFQAACAEGIDVCGLHHQRKAQQGGGKPRLLSDVYGSRWLTAGAGSVVMLWGEAGDPVVEMSHLKQPDEPVGPLTIVHDHAIGHSRVEARANEYTVVMSSPKGSSLAMVATEVYGDAERKSVEMARRKLDRMVNEGKVHRVEAGTGRGHSALYFPIDQHRGEA